MAEAALIVFARAPVPGRVKTRLARRLSMEERLALHCAFLNDTLEMAAGVAGADKYLALDKIIGSESLAIPPGFKIIEQRGEGLGERLHRAFEQLFGSGYRRVIAIGSDSPTLPPSFLEEALGCLAEFEVVIGPARDGGYYLIGCSRLEPGLFERIPWGSRRVLGTTLDRIKKLGLSYSLLPQWHDIDRWRDLIELASEFKAGICASAARQTERVLRALEHKLKR